MSAIIKEALDVVQGEVLDILHFLYSYYLLILFIVHTLVIVTVNGGVLLTGGASKLRFEIKFAKLFSTFYT